MYYVVALGNLGEKYEKTRHNVGFILLDYILDKLMLPKPESSMAYSGKGVKGKIANKETFFLYPETFMNNSGIAVKKLVSPDQVNNLIVIYDDVDLPLGKIKISQGRGDGGHNGIKSIINSLGDKDFVRLRIGIAPINPETGLSVRPQGDELASFVLKKFTVSELEELNKIKENLFNLLEIIIRDGVVKAMNVGNS